MEEKIDYAGKLAVIPNRKRGFSLIRVEERGLNYRKLEKYGPSDCHWNAYRSTHVMFMSLSVYSCLWQHVFVGNDLQEAPFAFISVSRITRNEPAITDDNGQKCDSLKVVVRLLGLPVFHSTHFSERASEVEVLTRPLDKKFATIW